MFNPSIVFSVVKSINLLSSALYRPFISSFGLFTWYAAIACSIAFPYNSILLLCDSSLESFIMFIIIGTAIKAIIASITITAKSSINVNPLLYR